MSQPPYLSIIAPLYNEEESVALLHERISEAARAGGYPYEIVFVDDGSADATFSKAQALTVRDPHLKVVKFRRNYGQTAAMAAGIRYARGKILVTMDGDLQNDPRDIPLMLEQIESGYDIVVGWRHKRQDKLITRKIPSVIANRLIAKVTGVPIRDNGCSLKAFKADIIKRIPLYSEMHRFIPAMASLAGARVAQIKVRHHARQFGTSKYGLSRIYRVALDLLMIKTIISFAQRPLFMFWSISLPVLATSFTSLLAAFAALVQGDIKVFNVVGGISVLTGGLSFFLLMGGAIAEMVTKTSKIDLNELSGLSIRKLSGNDPDPRGERKHQPFSKEDVSGNEI